MENSTIQMKPLTFGQIFWKIAPVIGGLIGAMFFGMLYLMNADNARYSHAARNDALFGAIFMGIVFGIFIGWNSAKAYQGEIIVKECDDPKKVLAALAVRLAGNRYSRETQTEFLHTFTPPLRSSILRVSILQEGLTLRIVGPKCVLEKLRDV